MAKTRILEITLSVVGTGDEGYQNPDRASGDQLVISVRIKGAKKYARRRARPQIRPTA